MDQERQSSVREEGALLLGLHEEVLEVEQGLLRRLHVDESCCNARFVATSSTAALVNVILRDAPASVTVCKVSRALQRVSERTSISFGIVKLMTCWISLKSSPLEATPEATMTSFLPDLNDLIAYSRSSWAAGVDEAGQQRLFWQGQSCAAGNSSREGARAATCVSADE